MSLTSYNFFEFHITKKCRTPDSSKWKCGKIAIGKAFELERIGKNHVANPEKQNSSGHDYMWRNGRWNAANPTNSIKPINVFQKLSHRGILFCVHYQHCRRYIKPTIRQDKYFCNFQLFPCFRIRWCIHIEHFCQKVQIANGIHQNLFWHC